jgi:hypothetical protein
MFAKIEKKLMLTQGNNPYGDYQSLY